MPAGRASAAGLAALAALAVWAGDSTGQSSPREPRLSIGQKVGQRLVLGFPGTRPPRALIARIRKGEAAGVILFGRNVRSRSQLRRLVRSLQRIPRPRGLRQPLLVMVDQEGGPVRRIPGGPRRSAAAVGRTRSTRAAAAAGREAARALRGVGANVDLAPVLDVGRPGGAMRRERRSFGGDPRLVARLGTAFARALERRRVAATLKHFPGFGAARANTDFRPVTIRLPARRLRRVDEHPFRAARRVARLVMLSTALYPALDGRWPAALSHRIATRELRGRVRFRGVSVTDALGTPAVRRYGSTGRVSVRAASAGTDLLLFSSYVEGTRAARALARGLRSGRLRRSAFDRSVRRVLRLRGSLGS